ncbi:MAG: IPT/TIG domain-containing protein, partial [Myxococcota bacterium]
MKRLTLAFLLGSFFTVGCGQRLVGLPPEDDDTTDPVPVLSSISPQRGPAAGGTSVVITGTDLAGATSVTFGSSSASFTVNSNTQITAVSPPGTATVNVRVVTPGGTSNLLPYAYADAPLITGITPPSGLVAGGATVVITGSAFTDASSVTFGGTAATSFVVNSASQITAVTPAHAAGTVPVVVTTPIAASNVFTFTYGEAPQLVSIAPNLGPTTGGTVVTLTGDHLTGATAVTFGTTAVTTVTVVNDDSVTVAAPAHAAGVVA